MRPGHSTGSAERRPRSRSTIPPGPPQHLHDDVHGDELQSVSTLTNLQVYKGVARLRRLRQHALARLTTRPSSPGPGRGQGHMSFWRARAGGCVAGPTRTARHAQKVNYSCDLDRGERNIATCSWDKTASRQQATFKYVFVWKAGLARCGTAGRLSAAGHVGLWPARESGSL